MTWRAALTGVLTVSAIVTIGVAVVGNSPETSETANEVPAAAAPATSNAATPCTPSGYAGDGPLPTVIRIPKIGVISSLVPLCLDPNGEIQVPGVDHPEQAGYYAQGYRPGDKGSAVILGHVDGDRQLGVFHSLSRLTKGDKITVDRADGSKVNFVVDKTETVLKKDFDPKRIYGPATTPELKLISCGGRFSPQQEGYLANVITSAHLVK